jgi:peptide/nickel transport system substrate-binding protein
MIGTGPFKLVEHVQDQFVRLEANKDYYAGAPNIDGAVFQTYDNSDAMVQGLVNGDVDMISEFPFTAIPALQNTENVVIADGTNFGGQLADIYFNQITPEHCPAAATCTGHPALKDVKVRQALATAVDKQALIDIVLLGLADKGLGLVTTAQHDWYATELEAEDYQFSLENAAQMLEDAGYKDTDGDGIRECPTADCGPSGDLTFRMYYPDSNLEHPRVSEQLKEWWEQIGVKAEVSVLDSEALGVACCATYDFDVILWSWYSGLDPEDLVSVLDCNDWDGSGQPDSIESGTNETGWCSDEYDQLYAEQTVEQDPAVRRQEIVDLQRIALEEVVYIVPWYYPSVMAYRSDKFTGWPDDHPSVILYDPLSLTVIRPAS